jgi:hypothetical protein
MKRLTLLSTLILIPFLGLKSQEYVPFPTENINWNVFLTFSCDDNIPPDTLLLRYTIHGDTTINEIVYNKLCLESGDTLDPSIEPVGGLREDGKKIYFIGKDFEGYSHDEELLLYDFTKQIGDTIRHDSDGYFYSVIEDIDSIMIGSDYRKRYMVDNHWFFHNPDYIVEGIGSILNGLLGHITMIPLCGYHYWEHICFKESGQVMYLNPSYDECFPREFFVSLRENFIVESIKIYPNPFFDKMYIDNLPEGKILSVQIINCLGQPMVKNALTSGINEISIPSKSGFFIALIMDDNGEIYKNEKILKK